MKTYKKGPHFLTDEKHRFQVVMMRSSLEDAKARIKFVKKGLKGRIRFDRLLGAS